MQKVPFLVYEVASPAGNVFVAHVDQQGELIQAFEINPNQIGTPGHEPPPPFQMIVNKPTGEFSKEAGFGYLPAWGASIDNEQCTGFELLVQVAQDDAWREFLEFLYQSGLERPH